ncbi:uncharacterized protein (UPF0548 family) [Glaciihabitans tibetensis]|uniref:Uncharacterized protein (UPF0548 family) n=1 Tax=Glaciihabitans tibetensis TaxID=1266600 RepID=A0A2T0VJ10_9MICO|nr:DUF1990 domain-containing protein [Glaciihabitans tibetensis]PRY70216.1 uncharacterized protein (UPF0548 family) [Glaciihabitans tibetensis]
MADLPLWERPVSYGAVGATLAADLMHYPPRGFRPAASRVRLGFGDARWAYACTATLSWAIQRGSGFAVELAESPTDVTDRSYSPVGFDADGTPVDAASIDGGGDIHLASDGTVLLKAGDTANLVSKLGPLTINAPVRVVYVIDEPTRKGFAYGTLSGHPVSGEESWIVEREDDGSVWLTIRAFSRPARWYWWIAYPAVRVMQRISTRRYQRALTGPIPE